MGLLSRVYILEGFNLDLSETKKRLDRVSACFCPAKWLQVTLRLQNGQTHSCHHPKAHKVPLDELARNPSALHNTQLKMLQRRQMLQGKRPKECQYCWTVEDLPGKQTSDRHLKSNDDWANPFIEQVAERPWNQDISPTYLEVSFSNTCNFKCAYCYPDVSSKMASEIKEFGPYPTTDFLGSFLHLRKENRLVYPENQNPYIDAFWKWLPAVLPHLHYLRVTGGEPLLSKNTQKLIEFIKENPKPGLVFSLNSNLGVPEKIVSQFIRNIKFLRDHRCISRAELYTSLDCWGAQAEYVRHGLDLHLWQNNTDLCLREDPNIQFTIMVTFNALSPFSFADLIHYVARLKSRYGHRVQMDTSILHDPVVLDCRITAEFGRPALDHCLDLVNKYGFQEHEIAKIKRLRGYLETPLRQDQLEHRQFNFVRYFDEYDRRKKTSFQKTFPELIPSYGEWKSRERLRSPYKNLTLKALCRAQKWIGPGI